MCRPLLGNPPVPSNFWPPVMLGRRLRLVDCLESQLCGLRRHRYPAKIGDTASGGWPRSHPSLVWIRLTGVAIVILSCDALGSPPTLHSAPWLACQLLPPIHVLCSFTTPAASSRRSSRNACAWTLEYPGRRMPFHSSLISPTSERSLSIFEKRTSTLSSAPRCPVRS
jgi:hypothetical protein